jgi:hypothetical protein
MESSSQSHGNIGSDSVPIPVDLRVVCFIVGVLALFAPLIVVIYFRVTDWYVTIQAMTWMVSGSWFQLMEGIMLWGPLPFTVWRVVFVYQMVRYYKGRSTRMRTFLLGLLAEMVWTGFMIAFTLSMPGYWGPLVMIPTPLMLFGASVFLWMTPYPVPKTPFDDHAEPDRWWREEADTPVGQPTEPRRGDGLIHAESRLKCPRCGSEEIGREMHPGSFGIRARFVYSCSKCRNRWEG